MAANNHNNPATYSVDDMITKAWNTAVDELEKAPNHKDDADWLKKPGNGLDPEPGSASQALDAFVKRVDNLTHPEVKKTPSGHFVENGGVKKLQHVLSNIVNAINTSADATLSLFGPGGGGICKMASDTCEEADERSLLILSDCVSAAFDAGEKVGDLIANLGHVEDVEALVVRLYVIIFKFWACAARRVHNKEASNHARIEYAAYIEKMWPAFHDDLNAQINSIREKLAKLRQDAESIGDSREKVGAKLMTNLSTAYMGVNKLYEGEWQDGTCDWISEERPFRDWKGLDEPNILWIHGAAGMGKTMLAWYIINKIMGSLEMGVDKLFFYCTHEHTTKDATAITVLRSLVYQIFQQNWQDRSDGRRFTLHERTFGDLPGFIDVVNFFSDENNLKALAGTGFSEESKKQSPGLHRIISDKFRELLLAIPSRGPVRIVLDGLDEYQDVETQKLLAVLKPLCQRCPTLGRPVAKLLLVSRPTVSLIELQDSTRVPIPNAPKGVFECFELPDDRVKKDVRKYLTAKLQAQLRAFTHDSFDATQAEAKAEEFVQGLLSNDSKAPPFQWASILIGDLAKNQDLVGLQNGLKRWYRGGDYHSDDLQRFYAKVLLRLESNLGPGYSDTVAKVLVWAAYARNVLTTAEMTELLNLGDDKKRYTEESLTLYLRTYCGSIFRLEPDAARGSTRRLHFIHYSVAEFLRCDNTLLFKSLLETSKLSYHPDTKGELAVPPSQGHSQIFRDCISYLSSAAFGRSLVSIRGNATVRAKLEAAHSFFSYTATRWPYHLTRVADEDNVKDCLKVLDGFFQKTHMKTWMEGVLALGEGGDRLPTICAQIKNWLRTNSDRVNEGAVRHFHKWVADISGPGFRDYEQTLLHNNNEVHFVDQDLLLPSISQVPDRLKDREDRLQKLELPEISASFLPESVDRTKRDHLEDPLLPSLCFPHPLFVGEDADDRFGFLSLDRNDASNQGLLMIDKKSNHPRLVWEKVSAAASRDQSTNPEDIRLTSILPLARVIDHSQFVALSAALNGDGTKVAALYREDTDRKKGLIRLRLILWQFHPDDTEVDKWRRAVNGDLAKLTSSVIELYQLNDTVRQAEEETRRRTEQILASQGVHHFPSARRAEDTTTSKSTVDDDSKDSSSDNDTTDNDDDDSAGEEYVEEPLEDARPGIEQVPQQASDLHHTMMASPSLALDLEKIAFMNARLKDLHLTVTENKTKLIVTLGSRPAVPSTTPLESGDSWASVEELLPPENRSGIAMEGNLNSPFADSAYLVAFSDPNTMVLPFGVFQIDGFGLKQFPPDVLDRIRSPLVVVPRGQFLVYLTEDSRGLVIIDLRRGVLAPSRFEWRPSRRFELIRVVDCSDSGCRVVVEVQGLQKGQMGLVVVDLDRRDETIFFQHDQEEGRFGVSRVFFCPMDRHLLVVTHSRPKGIGHATHTLFMVDTATGRTSLIEHTKQAPIAVAHFHCRAAGCIDILSSDKQRSIPSAMEQSLANAINLQFQSHTSTQETASTNPTLLRCEGEDRDAPQCSIIRQRITANVSDLLGKDAIFSRLAFSPQRTDLNVRKRTGDTALTVVFDDRSVQLLTFVEKNQRIKGLHLLSATPEYMAATCKPSWVDNRVCAAYLTITLNSENTSATVLPRYVSWKLDLAARADQLLGLITGNEVSVPITPIDLVCRGLSLSRDTGTLVYWLGSNIWFSRRTTKSTLAPLAQVPDTSRNYPSRTRGGLKCLEVAFNQNDTFAAVLWSKPPESIEDGQAIRGSLLELYDLSQSRSADKVVVRDALDVDCDARAFHFHPMPDQPGRNLIIITTRDCVRLYRYGREGFKLVRAFDKKQVKKYLAVPWARNGPASPDSTDQTTVPVPITGLSPMYFSTCGIFVFARNWRAFATVEDLLDLKRASLGTWFIREFCEGEVNSIKSKFTPGVQSAAILAITQQLDQSIPSAERHMYEIELASPHWEVPADHPRIMYEDSLYAVGRHRFKIFRIRTYIVLGWSAEAHNLFIPESKLGDRHTWYRRVLCAVPQSMSTWRATLIWPNGTHPDDFLAVVLFPPPGGEIKPPIVIHCPLRFMDLKVTSVKKNGDYDDGWLRGHAFGCPYQLKAAKKEKVAGGAAVEGGQGLAQGVAQGT